MKVRFWGARGSIATPLSNQQLADKIESILQSSIEDGLRSQDQIHDFVQKLPWYLRYTAGGDTTCVEVNAGEILIILDAGTGIRPLGLDLLGRYKKRPIEAHVLLSHTHWDHICGIPFFVPAFIPGNDIRFYGAHSSLEDRLKHQQDFDYFPVPMSIMGGIKQFIQLEENQRFQIGNIDVQTMLLNHPGKSIGYRIAHKNKVIVFATDSEYKELSADSMKPYMEFFQGADMVIFDAQYTFFENVEKEDWGHSNVFVGIDMALEAGVKNLVFTHHEPTYNDEKLWSISQQASEYLKIHSTSNELRLHLAYEGLTMEL